MWSPRIVRRWLERDTGTAISVWLTASRQAETPQSSEIHLSDGEMARLQNAEERFTVEPEKGCNSEEDWCWVGLELGEPIPVADSHTSQRCSWRTVFHGGDAMWPQGRTVMSVLCEEEQAAGTIWKELGLTAPPSCVLSV